MSSGLPFHVASNKQSRIERIIVPWTESENEKYIVNKKGNSTLAFLIGYVQY